MAIYLGEKPVAGFGRGIKVNTANFLGENHYFAAPPTNSAAWLKSNGEFKSGEIYTDFYQWLVNAYNNVVSSGNIAVKLSSEEYTDADFVINEDENTFRLPLYVGRVAVQKLKVEEVNGVYYAVRYSDGWCEQSGTGRGGTNATNPGIVHLPIAYADADYAITLGVQNNAHYTDTAMWIDKTNSQFGIVTGWNGSNWGSFLTGWETAGFAAIPTMTEFNLVEGLYFFVGEGIKNADNVDAEVSNILSALNDKVNINSDVIDGQWVFNHQILFEGVTAIGNYSYDLSEYLPDDGADYEIMLRVYTSDDHTSSGTNCWSGVGSEPQPCTLKTGAWVFLTTDTYSDKASNTLCMPVRGRTLYAEIAQRALAFGMSVNLIGYRKLGTNRSVNQQKTLAYIAYQDFTDGSVIYYVKQPLAGATIWRGPAGGQDASQLVVWGEVKEVGTATTEGGQKVEYIVPQLSGRTFYRDDEADIYE
ncbi:MAG: hypothetical protein IJ184_07180 [Alphaproteobacteria bacterium]|nr:hypothetical protein [Alphaproteobacteria bacterium]